MGRTISSGKFGSTDTAKNGNGAIKAKAESQVLAAANPARVALVVCNDGETDVYLALDAVAVKNEGIRLNAKGGSITLDFYSGPVAVVTAAGESVVTFAEA